MYNTNICIEKWKIQNSSWVKNHIFLHLCVKSEWQANRLRTKNSLSSGLLVSGDKHELIKCTTCNDTKKSMQGSHHTMYLCVGGIW